MLLTAVLPFCDLRQLAVAGFSRLPRPQWPNPALGHVRGIGGVRTRHLHGFDSWVGENSLVCGLPAIALHLPLEKGKPPLELVRKACYFDNVVNGRFEFLVRVNSEPDGFAAAATAARDLLERSVTLRRSPDQPARRLGGMARQAASLWALATVKRGSDPLPQWIRSRRPFVVVESEVALGPVANGAPAGVRLSIEQNGKPFELFAIYPPPYALTGPRSYFRASARTIRTYLLRMLQDVEALSQICASPELQLDDDRVQAVFNEYTRHILRSRAKVQNSTDLTAYCYAAFADLYPAHIEGLRTQVLGSAMRPNVRSKLLELLDEVEQAVKYVVEELVLGDKVMGDKYEDIDVKGSQGVAFGRGASANVTGSVNQSADPELVAALRDLASKVRESGKDDAAIEAEIIESAAAKAEQGDEKGAVSLLKRVGKWALGIGTTVGTAALTGFLKTNGIG